MYMDISTVQVNIGRKKMAGYFVIGGIDGRIGIVFKERFCSRHMYCVVAGHLRFVVILRFLHRFLYSLVSFENVDLVNNLSGQFWP